MDRTREVRRHKGQGQTIMQSLKGHFLIAMPSMLDDRFARAVIYIIEHGPQGAMGLVVNKKLELTFGEVLTDLDLDSPDSADEPIVAPQIRDLPVHNGGPVDKARGFVLHSDDYFQPGASVRIDSNIVLSANRDILTAIARHNMQPEKSLFALGYAGWEAGQLEQELAENAWLTVEGEPEILFNTDMDSRYTKSLSLLGLTAANLSQEAGIA